MEKKIIVVDDEPDVGFTIKFTLEEPGKLDVINVESGEECLELLEKSEHKPDLIILDIMMPGMSGWEVFYKLKENPSWEKIPVVFLTARADPVAEKAGKFLGEDYIEKPYDSQDLKEKIRKILGMK